MNKKEYKRYKKITKEIGELKQHIDEIMLSFKESFCNGEETEMKELQLSLIGALKDLSKRESIKETLALPKSLKLEDAIPSINGVFGKIENEERKKEIIGEFCSIYLLDNYNNKHYDFTYALKGNDIYITDIRWHKNQVLVKDLKNLLKGDISKIKIGDVELVKNKVYDVNEIIVWNRDTLLHKSMTLKETITYLENEYLM